VSGPFDPVLTEAAARSDSIRKETKSAAVKLYDSLVIAFGERDIPEEYNPSLLDSRGGIEPERLPPVHDRPESPIENASEVTSDLSPGGAEGVQAIQGQTPPAASEISQKAMPESTPTKTPEKNGKSNDVTSNGVGIRGSTPVIQIKEDERNVGRDSATGSRDQKSKGVPDITAEVKKPIQPKSEPKVELKTNTDSNRSVEIKQDSNLGEKQVSITSAASAKTSVESIANVESAPRELEENEVFFPRNSFLFAKGDKADFFYVIVSGKIQLIEPRGQTLIATLEPPTSFGEQAILAGGIRSLSAQAIEPTICKAYSVDTLGKLLDRAKGTNKPVIYALLLELYMRNDIKSHQVSGN
jgi:hypothetical protein